MLPEVHLGIDPEFSMKNGKKPGTFIGTLDAEDINQAAEILAKIVRDNNLPPKILLVHRFTNTMITNAENIRPLKEVQIIMDMDGVHLILRKVHINKLLQKSLFSFLGLNFFIKMI